jgi:hypothetical protein
MPFLTIQFSLGFNEDSDELLSREVRLYLCYRNCGSIWTDKTTGAAKAASEANYHKNNVLTSCDLIKSMTIKIWKPHVLFPQPINQAAGKNDHPVFITGAPRCGSSWVGEILGSCAKTRYVYEPFNHKWGLALARQLPHFTYLNASSEVSSVVQQISNKAFLGLQSWQQLARAAYRGYWAATIRPANRVVIKDPTASLMSEWITKQFSAKVLFIMRHPCGFASSLDALDWNLNVNSLLRQHGLMQDHLRRFKDVMYRAKNDKWHTRGAVWAAIHTVYSRQHVTHSDWLLCKYEDICNNPEEQFDSITKKLGLKLSNNTREKIRSQSTTAGTDSGSTNRTSSAMPDIWQQRMSSGEIDAVMGIVSEFGLDYYIK